LSFVPPFSCTAPLSLCKRRLISYAAAAAADNDDDDDNGDGVEQKLEPMKFKPKARYITWPGGVTVTAFDLRLEGRAWVRLPGFPLFYIVTTFVKFFTHCSIIWYNSLSEASHWGGNRRFGVPLASRHRLHCFFHLM